MGKRSTEDVASDLQELSQIVSGNAARVVQSFLEAECAVSANLDPRRAKQKRSRLLKNILICAQVTVSQYPKAPAMAFARSLSNTADSLRENNPLSRTAEVLENLASLVRDVRDIRREEERQTVRAGRQESER